METSRVGILWCSAALLAATVCCPVAWAQVELRLSPAAGDPGATVEVPVIYSNAGTADTWGWSFGVGHDWSDLVLLDVTAGVDFEGLVPEFEQRIIWAAGWTTVTVLSFDGTLAIAPGGELELYRAQYEILSSCGAPPIPLVFTDELGFPPVIPSIALAGTPAAPDLFGTTIEVTGSSQFSYIADEVVLPASGTVVAHFAISEDWVGSPSDTQGFSMGVTHNPEVAEVLEINPFGPLAEISGGGPDFFAADALPDGWTVGTVYSFGVYNIQFPLPTDVIAVTYGSVGAADGATTTLVFSDQLGSPPVENVLVVNGLGFATCGVPGSITVTALVEFIRGDTNDDGAIDVADMVVVLDRVIYGAPPGTCLDADDVNGDGQLDIADAIYGLSYAFSGGAVPPAPAPDCGFVLPVLGCEESSCQ